MSIRPGYQVKRLGELGRALRIAGQLEGHDRRSRPEIEALQRRLLETVVAHAAAHSPFYRERLSRLPDPAHATLEELPTVARDELMDDFDRWVTNPQIRLADVQSHLDGLDRRDDYYLGRYRAMTTGGSSGRKGIFLFDRRQWAIVLALTLRWSRLMGVGPRLPRLRSATVAAGNPRHITYRVAVTVNVGAAKILRLDATTPIRELVGALNDFRPDHLHAYPSVAALLADEQTAGRLAISPRVISTSSELRTEEMTARIKEAWGTEPFDCYGITEVGLFGNDCEYHRGLHAFDDLFIFEVVDDDDQPVPVGETGRKLLVTNLFNYTQPLIRYEITDMIAVSPEPCPCGRPFPLLKAVEGRSDDILYLADGSGGTVPVHPMHFRSPLAAAAEVRQYQVVQRADEILLTVVPSQGATAEVIRESVLPKIAERLRGAGAEPPDLRVEVVDAIERNPDTMSKLKLIRSEVTKR